MRSQGWMIVALAGLAATTAHADQRRAPTRQAALPQQAKKLAAKAKARSSAPQVDAQLLALTNDPLLGKADRISGEEVRGLVAFTFDDGPNPETTPAVIDALQSYHVPATFFIVTRRLAGKASGDARAILKRQLEGGFVIGSHTVTHKNLRGASPEKLAAEIDQSIRTLAREAERPIGMFRAPFGAIDARGRGWLANRGLTETFWSIDTRDWQAKNAEQLRKKIFKMIVRQDGGVVLMHDVKQITAAITAHVLDDLEAENCKRLADGRTPIWPVSIHYFLRDKKQRRAIPDDVKKTTEAYQAALPERCATRTPTVPVGFELFFLE